jgi:hypothetical protein
MMKKLFFIVTSIFLLTNTVSLKAATQPTQAVTPSKTPFVSPSIVGQINLAYIRVGDDLKNGKLTSDQAKALKLKLTELFKQMYPCWRSKDKTPEINSKINQGFQQLQTIKQSIP